jgi:uncharacterized protein YceK
MFKHIILAILATTVLMGCAMVRTLPAPTKSTADVMQQSQAQSLLAVCADRNTGRVVECSVSMHNSGATEYTGHLDLSTNPPPGSSGNVETKSTEDAIF